MNKIDGPKQEANVAEFHRLGVTSTIAISAEHGLGFDALIDALVSALPEAAADPDSDGADMPLRIALVGRPNAGKSALLNRLLGEERSIVSDTPGTTRDPVNAQIATEHGAFELVDTAGIRRKRRSGPAIEQIAVMRSFRAIEDCDVACLLIDASGSVGGQDARIANAAMESGRGLVVAFNKIDLVVTRETLRDMFEERLRFVDFVPLHMISAKTGQGVLRLLAAFQRVSEHASRRIGTADLNRFLEASTNMHHPPSYRGKAVRFYYVTQPQTRPPTFVFSTSHPKGVTESYKRFLVNRLRAEYKFEGVPLRLFFRAHRERKS